MFSAGVMSSMILPSILAGYALMIIQGWPSIALFILNLGNIAFTLFFSPKVGDFRKSILTLREK